MPKIQKTSLEAKNFGKSWFSIPVAGWILSALTFASGTVVIPLYEHFTFNGVSIAQPYDVRAFQNNDEFKTITYSTVIKVANGVKSSLVIDSIEANLLQKESSEFQFIGARASNVRDNSLHFPITPETGDTESHLPIMIKPESSAILQIEFVFRHTFKNGDSAIPYLQKIVETEGIPIKLRVNGKFRSYTLVSMPFPMFSTRTSSALHNPLSNQTSAY